MAQDPISKREFMNDLQHCSFQKGLGGGGMIYDNFGKIVGSVDSFGNILDSSGMPKGSVGPYGSLKDNQGNLKGGLDKFGNLR